MSFFMPYRRSLLLVGVLCLLGAMSNAQEMAQTINLVSGWNAIHLKIAPKQTAEALFEEWPVQSVGVYDAASFARTKQFDATSSSEGLPSPAVRLWQRQVPGSAEVFALPANAALLCFATNSFTTTLYGVPEALRYSWHPTDPGLVYNYIGISTAPGATPTLSAYFSGLKLESLAANLLYGSNPQVAAMGSVGLTINVADGRALAMTGEQVSDWSGVFYVTPQHGLAFGSETDLQSLAIRNDAATARRARLTYRFGEAANALEIPPRCAVLYRDLGSVGATGAWQSLPEQMEKLLQPGETWQLTLALNHEQFDGVAVGTRYGGLLDITDIDGGSWFRTTIPLSATANGGAGTRRWPTGLWVADVRLDKVTQVVNDAKLVEGIPAGGNMKLRLPLHVDYDGCLTLLQRVVAAGEVAEDGTITPALYAGNAPIPVTANQALRISAVSLPVDQPIINGTGNFGVNASFDFTVAADSPANPLRHALHPNHDGLKPDFQTSAPSGDDFENYVSKVKPELFSISNTVTFVWDDLPAGAAAWNPEETLHGKLIWDFVGLRRQGTLRTQGRFTMRRVSKSALLEGR